MYWKFLFYFKFDDAQNKTAHDTLKNTLMGLNWIALGIEETFYSKFQF